MKEIIKKIFESYKFSCKWEQKDIEFYKNTDPNIASYFLIRYIDGTALCETPASLLIKLKELETQYIDNGDSENIKKTIQSLFENKTEAAQIDKNTSAIFPIKLNNLDRLDEYRNLIYSVEESPYYFRRFVIPYTENQTNGLVKIIGDNKEKDIYEILSDIANDETAYYDLASHKNLDNVYEFVIRLFSKIPFLQYTFKAEQKPMSIEHRIELELNQQLLPYHKLVKEKVDSIEQLLEFSNYVINHAELEKEIADLLRSDKYAI